MADKMRFLFDKTTEKCPCIGCTNRTVGCHGKCELYACYNKANEERCKRKFELKENERNISSFKFDCISKTVRANGKTHYPHVI